LFVRIVKMLFRIDSNLQKLDVGDIRDELQNIMDLPDDEFLENMQITTYNSENPIENVVIEQISK